MPAERIAMRQVRDVLRLKFPPGYPAHEIARRVGVAPSTVRLTLKRFDGAGLSWPLPAELTDAALEAQLFTASRHQAGPSPPRRARLGGGSSRAEAQARHAADPVGRIHRAPIPTGTAIRGFASSTAAGNRKFSVDDAADPRRRRASCSSIMPATRCRWSSTG